MVDYNNIYTNLTADYDLLVKREDFEGNLMTAICGIINPKNKNIVEFGAGTGRLTTLLAPHAKQIIIFDNNPQMLKIAEKKLKQLKLTNWAACIADHRNIPLNALAADLAIEGWAFGHLVEMYWNTWQKEIDKALNEMKKLLISGGTIIIIETLGTGHETPTPPNDKLASFYQYLENNLGFSHKAVRTDYKFKSKEEAHHLVLNFWGKEKANKIVHSAIVPECTGLWWKKVNGALFFE